MGEIKPCVFARDASGRSRRPPHPARAATNRYAAPLRHSPSHPRRAPHARSHGPLHRQRFEHLRGGGGDDVQARELHENVEHLRAKVHARELGEERELLFDCGRGKVGEVGSGVRRDVWLGPTKGGRDARRACRSRCGKRAWTKSREGSERTLVRGQRQRRHRAKSSNSTVETRRGRARMTFKSRAAVREFVSHHHSAELATPPATHGRENPKDLHPHTER